MSGQFIPEEISFIVSSDPNSGARNVSADGSGFEIQLEDSLKIPKEAKNITVSVEEATVWWVVPNIITGTNDQLRINVPNTSDVVTVFNITIPQGLYDLTGLNNAILRELETAGAKISPRPLINLSADVATQRVSLRLEYPTVSVDFTISQTPRQILGYNSQAVGPLAGAPQNVLAPNVAAFNTINYFLIHSDLVSRGIRFNNEYNQSIAQVLINVPPGSQIVSTPFNPAKTHANEWLGLTEVHCGFG